MVQIFKPQNKSAGRRRKLPMIQVTVSQLDHRGQGVCRDHQPVIFAAGALPGETCQVQITAQKKRHWFGQVDRVLAPHPQRIVPFCPHFSKCGGCQTQYAPVDTMLVYKQQAVSALLQRIGVVDIPWQTPLISPSQGYRRKARLALDARNQARPVLGFRHKDSAKVLSIAFCDILYPSLQALLPALQGLIAKLKNLAAIGHIGLLRGEELTQVSVRLSKSISSQDRALWAAFGQAQQCQVMLESTKGKFDCLSLEDQSLYYLAEADCRIQIAPNDFVQVNDSINRQMIRQAIDWLALEQDDRLLDLFCGVGNFALPLARRCAGVIGIEGVAEMVERAARNARLNKLDNLDFQVRDLNQANSLSSPALDACNKVLLDPARDGADGLVQQLTKAQVVCYVSCNPATFVRDAQILHAQRYRLDKIGLMDMFPNSAHTELMALFVRQAG